MIVAYEWLCADPIARFEELHRRLEMTWTRRAERFIRGADADGDQRAYSITRRAAKQIDKWKQSLSADDIESCRRFVEPFGLPYYPAFEPHVASISGDRNGATTAPA
jgi:hypothetical protein